MGERPRPGRRMERRGECEAEDAARRLESPAASAGELWSRVRAAPSGGGCGLRWELGRGPWGSWSFRKRSDVGERGAWRGRSRAVGRARAVALSR